MPRTKTKEQIFAELETLHRLGYRGHLDFVDELRQLVSHAPHWPAVLRAFESSSLSCMFLNIDELDVLHPAHTKPERFTQNTKNNVKLYRSL